MEKSHELLEKLIETIKPVHVDMAGNKQHRYTLTHKSHILISEIKIYLSESVICNDCGHPLIDGLCPYDEWGKFKKKILDS